MVFQTDLLYFCLIGSGINRCTGRPKCEDITSHSCNSIILLYFLRSTKSIFCEKFCPTDMCANESFGNQHHKT